jgi:hypothetical protein
MTSETQPKPERNAKAPKKRAWFGPIDDYASAKTAARNGAIAGLIFAGMYLLGALLIIFAGRSPTTGEATTDFEELGIYLVIIDAILTALILFLSWRVSTGRGYISAGLLLVWFVGECVMKALGGATSIGWIFFYLAVAATMFDGLRGCWLGRRVRPMPDAATFD